MKVRVQFAPGLTLEQVLPDCVTRPLKAVPEKLAAILLATSVAELLVIVIVPEELGERDNGEPLEIAIVASGGAFTAIVAVVSEVLVPLIITEVAATAVLPGVKLSVHDCPTPKLEQFEESWVTFPSSAVPVNTAAILVAVSVGELLVIVSVPATGVPVVPSSTKGEPAETAIVASVGTSTATDTPT